MPPLVIAHRGDSAHRPENTLAAFEGALALGAGFIELDVHQTRDGEVVVIHDPTLDRTTSGTGRVAERSASELRSLSAGYPARFGEAYREERVPLLRDVLRLAQGRARVMIEIKPEAVLDDEAVSIEARTLAVVREARMEQEVAFISFSPRALLRCHAQAPEILRGHLFHQGTPSAMIASLLAVHAEVCMPEKSLLSEELRDRVRDAGARLATWVVDEPAELARLERFSLFGVGSNRPGELLAALSPPAGG